MRRTVYCITLVFALCFLTGCFGDLSESQENAELTTNAVYEHIQNKDFQGVIGYYSSDFFSATTEDGFIEMLKLINEKLGDLQSWEQTSSYVSSQVGTNSGTYVQLTYETTYSKYEAVETINLKKYGSEFKITGHNFNSEGFLLED
jgi:hypothetical protein